MALNWIKLTHAAYFSSLIDDDIHSYYWGG